MYYKKISAERLLEMRACMPQVQKFKRFLESLGVKSVKPTREIVAKAYRFGCDVQWAVKKGLIPRLHGRLVAVNGDIFWYKRGGLHREGGGPAEIWTDGSKFWYQNGRPYRPRGPAFVYACGKKVWYQNGYVVRREGGE